MQNSPSFGQLAQDRIEAWLAQTTPFPESWPQKAERLNQATTIQAGILKHSLVPPLDATRSQAKAAAHRGLSPLSPLNTCLERRVTGVKDVVRPPKIATGTREIRPADFAGLSVSLPEMHQNLHDNIMRREIEIQSMHMESEEPNARDVLHWHTRHSVTESKPATIDEGCGCPAGETIDPVEFDADSSTDQPDSPNAEDASYSVDSSSIQVSDYEDSPVRPRQVGILARKPHNPSNTPRTVETTTEKK